MSIYLVQHGASLPKEADTDQGLSDAGIAAVTRIACLAMDNGVVVDRILHSGKKRARQTAEIMARALQPRDGVQGQAGLNPMDDVQDYARRLAELDRHMLVGHLPFLARLVSYLITGSADRPVCQFQNGGIVCLDRSQDHWVIRWMLMPKIG